jgi:hypothetical protein
VTAYRADPLSRIATHPNPVERPVPSFMLRARVDDIEGGDSFAQLWSKRVGDDLFKVCCIPFFAYGLALGDVVRADSWVIKSVEQRSGNGLARVAIKRRVNLEPARSHRELFAGLAKLAGAVEVERLLT